MSKINAQAKEFTPSGIFHSSEFTSTDFVEINLNETNSDKFIFVEVKSTQEEEEIKSSKTWCFNIFDYRTKITQTPKQLADFFDGLGLYAFGEEYDVSSPNCPISIRGCIKFNEECIPEETIKMEGIDWIKCICWKVSFRYFRRRNRRTINIFTNFKCREKKRNCKKN